MKKMTQQQHKTIAVFLLMCSTAIVLAFCLLFGLALRALSSEAQVEVDCEYSGFQSNNLSLHAEGSTLWLENAPENGKCHVKANVPLWMLVLS